MDEITNVVRERGMVRVTVNEDRRLLVPLSLFQERPFTAGEEIDLAEYENWLMTRQYRHALDKAVAFLAVRSRSRRELEERLSRAGYLPATVEMVLFKLTKEGLLNDEEFAAQWVEAKSSKGLGRRRIAMDLMNKGVEKEAVEAAVAGVSPEEERLAACRLANKLWPRYQREGAPKGVQKCVQALVRRGFDWDTAKNAVRQAAGGDSEASRD